MIRAPLPPAVTRQVLRLVLVALIASTADIPALEVPVNGVFETAITNTTTYINKFRDVTLNATFTAPSGATTPFWGFFDGDGSGGPDRLDVINAYQRDSGGEETGTVWKLRFMPTELGTWTYAWSFSDGSKSGSGSFTAISCGQRPGVLSVDSQFPRWTRNDEGYFYPAVIEMHYGEQLAYDIDEYQAQYEKYITKGFNMVGFLWLPIWDFTTWQVNPQNNGGVSDPWITIWYQTQNHVNGSSAAYDSDRMLLFTWKRLEQHLGYLAGRGVYAFPFQGFNVKHTDQAEVDPHLFPADKYDWYMRYCMARLAPYYNLVWNSTWESDNGLSQFISGLDAYDPWRRPRMRVAKNSSDLIDINDADYSPEQVPATSSKPWWITENNNKTGLWGDSTGASGTANMDQDKVLDLSWRYLMRSAPVFLLEVNYVGYTDPSSHIAPKWSVYAASNGVTWFGLAHRFVRGHTRYWRMSNDNSLVSGTDVYCLTEPGSQYLCYRKIAGDITLEAAAGTYAVTWLDVKTGTTTSSSLTHGGDSVMLDSPGTNYRVVYLDNGGGVDITPPSVTVASPTEGAQIVVGQVLISGEASDACGVASVELRIDGGAWQTASGTTTWSLSLPSLALGAHTVEAQATDSASPANNTSEPTAPRSFTVVAEAVDTEPPSVPEELLAADTTETGTWLGWSESTDNVGVVSYEIFQDGSSIGTSLNAACTVTGLSPATTYLFTVLALDAAGNASAQSSPLAVTTLATNTPPVIDALSADPDPVTGTTTTLSVSASDADGDSLSYAWQATATPTGANPVTGSGQNPTVTFDRAGGYTFQVTVTDGCGGSAQDTVSVTVEQTADGLEVTP